MDDPDLDATHILEDVLPGEWEQKTPPSSADVEYRAIVAGPFCEDKRIEWSFRLQLRGMTWTGRVKLAEIIVAEIEMIYAADYDPLSADVVRSIADQLRERTRHIVTTRLDDEIEQMVSMLDDSTPEG